MRIKRTVATAGSAQVNDDRTDCTASINDDGFGLVEIVVSMLLIGVIAVSFLPVLVRALTASALNVTVATATQIINEQLDAGRASVRNCEQLLAFVSVTPAPVTDSQSIVLQANRSASDCNDANVNYASITVTVTRSDTAAIAAEATTLVTVKAAEADPEPGPTEPPAPDAGP